MDIGEHKRTIIIEPLENPVPEKEPVQLEPEFIEPERLILDATELVYELMEAEGVKKKDLAKRLGKGKGFVSQVLNGKRNMTLRTLADLLRVLGYRARLQASMLSEPVVPSRASTNAVFFDDAWSTSTAHRSWRHLRERPRGRQETAFGIVQLKNSGWHSVGGDGPTHFRDWFLEARERDRVTAPDEQTTGTYELVG